MAKKKETPVPAKCGLQKDGKARQERKTRLRVILSQ